MNRWVVVDETGAIRRTFDAPTLDEALASAALVGEAGPLLAASRAIDPRTHRREGDDWVLLPPPGPQPVPVPASLTRVQFLLVADSIGFTEAAIEAVITADTTLSDDERRGLLIRFRAATQFPRDWPHLDLLAAGLTSAQIDDLYRLGATL